jgi:hypothetical protein
MGFLLSIKELQTAATVTMNDLNDTIECSVKTKG